MTTTTTTMDPPDKTAIGTFLSDCLAFQRAGGGDDFYAETDTDTDNASLPAHRRWVWYCKLRSCPDYYRAWTLKTNFLLHLAETPVHSDDPATKTKKGRQQLADAWKEETAFDLSEPKKLPPETENTGTLHSGDNSSSQISGKGD